MVLVRVFSLPLPFPDGGTEVPGCGAGAGGLVVGVDEVLVTMKDVVVVVEATADVATTLVLPIVLTTVAVVVTCEGVSSKGP